MTNQWIQPISRFCVTTVCAASVLSAIIGCGDDSGLAQRYAVSGEVKYKGEPVEKGTISFKPEDKEGRPASGQIEKGYYSLTTLTPNDGALPGKYKVTIVSKLVDTSQMEAIAKGGQFHHDATFLKATKTAKNLVPSKYSLDTTSGLAATVEEKSNTVNFDLTD